MDNRSSLLKNANIIAACLTILFSVAAYFANTDADESYILLIASGFFMASYVLAHKGYYEICKWTFVLIANATIFIFDGGFHSNNPSYLMMIPLIMSYFVLNSYPKELPKTIAFIGISAMVVILVNLTDFAPKVTEQLRDELMVDFFGALIGSVSVVVILLSHDRNKHMKLEDMVKKNEELMFQLHAVIDAGLQNVCLFDSEGRIVLSDNSTEKTLRDNSNQPVQLGKTRFLNCLPDSLKEEFRNNFSKALSGEVVKVQRRIVLDDKETWVDAVYRPVNVSGDGQTPNYVVFAWHDVTEMMQAKTSFENSEKLLKSINQNIREGIYRSTIRDGWVYSNKAFSEMMGYKSSEELYGKDPAIMYVHLRDRQDLINNVRETGYFNSKAVELKRKDGSTFWASVSCMHHYDNDEEIFDVAVRDITEQKKTEAEVIRQKEKAEAASKAKADFLSVMSHEIRTPMNAILGFTNLTMEASYLKPEDRENLLAIEHSAENLLAIINDILDFSKIEAGKITIEKERFNIRNLLKELHHTTSFIARNKDLQMKFNIDPRMPEFITGDAVRLNQVLLNLCSNAIKFTAKGGFDLNTKVKSIDGKNILLQFTVTDTGIGIPADKIEQIFESFTQADPHISRRFGGTGLGLTISKRLVELMGGSISASSIESQGSTFIVEVPFAMSSHASIEQKAAAGTRLHDLSGYHFLLVEDNKMNIMLASQLLKKWKASFDVAENGVEATELLCKNSYDLVLLDLQLPYKSGFDVFNELKSESSMAKSKDIPVIALTADAFEETRERVFKSGMNDMATKPFEAEALYDKISYWLKS